MRASAYLDRCTNVFGILSPEVRQRLEDVIEHPNKSTWDNAYTIIVNGPRMMTLWQAWVAVDADAPRSGPRRDQKGRRISDWSRVPDQPTIYRALRYAAQEKPDE